MSKKSRHGKRKFSAPNNVRKEKQPSLTVTGPKPEISPVPVTVSHNGGLNSKLSMQALQKNPDTDEFSYIKGELLRVGILTAIVFIIMIVLGFILH